MTIYPTAEQRASANYCKVYARRTPMIPYHNGMMTYRIGPMPDGTDQIVEKPCLGCGKVENR
jgi:hypothetical protein